MSHWIFIYHCTWVGGRPNMYSYIYVVLSIPLISIALWPWENSISFPAGGFAIARASTAAPRSCTNTLRWLVMFVRHLKSNINYMWILIVHGNDSNDNVFMIMFANCNGNYREKNFLQEYCQILTVWFCGSFKFWLLVILLVLVVSSVLWPIACCVNKINSGHWFVILLKISYIE